MPVQEIPVMQCMVDLVDECGLFRRTDKILHTLFDLFRCAHDHKVKRPPEFLVLTDQFGNPGFETGPGVLVGRVCFAHVLVRDPCAVERLKEKGERRVLPDNLFTPLCKEPFRRRPQRRNLHTLPEVLVRYERILSDLLMRIRDIEGAPDQPVADVDRPFDAFGVPGAEDLPAHWCQVIEIERRALVENFCSQQDFHDALAFQISGHGCNLYYLTPESLYLSHHRVVTMHPSAVTIRVCSCWETSEPGISARTGYPWRIWDRTRPGTANSIFLSLSQRRENGSPRRSLTRSMTDRADGIRTGFSTTAPIFPAATPGLTARIAASRASRDASRRSPLFPRSTVVAVSAIYPSICTPRSSLITSPLAKTLSSPVDAVSCAASSFKETLSGKARSAPSHFTRPSTDSTSSR